MRQTATKTVTLERFKQILEQHDDHTGIVLSFCIDGKTGEYLCQSEAVIMSGEHVLTDAGFVHYSRFTRIHGTAL